MDYICTSCNYVGKRKKMKPGSRTIEILLWAVFLIPGPFYSVWRIICRRYACPQCGETKMVGATGKTGKELERELEQELSPENLKKIPFIWAKDVEEYNRKHGVENKTIQNILQETGQIKENNHIENKTSEESKEDNRNDQW